MNRIKEDRWARMATVWARDVAPGRWDGPHGPDPNTGDWWAVAPDGARWAAPTRERMEATIRRVSERAWIVARVRAAWGATPAKVTTRRWRP